jgi:predicted Zn-dependent protease
MKRIVLIFLLVILSSCATTPVTGKRAFILVPFSQELNLGSQAYREFLSKERRNVSTDRRITRIVKRVAMRIAKQSDMPNLKWEFTVIRSKQMNAFCLPGGKIVVYTGILPIAQNEAGLAAILAHEIGHAVARHGAQRMTQHLVLNAGLSAASLSLKDKKHKNLILASLGVGANVGVILRYSRKHEYEADEIGQIYMARAGYDPREAVNLWKRFSKHGRSDPEFLSTHPHSPNRANRLNQILSKAMQEYKNDN